MKTNRILFVDDEEFILLAIKRALRRENFTCDFANGPIAALARLKEQPYDIVVSDHLMPEMTGIQLLKQVKKEHPETLRIVLTGHADMGMVIEAINEGAIFRFVTKPWNDEELKVTLRTALQYHHALAENQALTSVILKQLDYIEEMEKKYPGISVVERQEDGTIYLDESALMSLDAVR
jgi:two-component system probable response regulator PhcQ